MTTILEARNILKTYSGRVALTAAELCFSEGEVVAVCGPNGSGKSTLLRILALLDYPDQGEMKFRGRELTSHGDWFSARRSITLVAQDPYAFHGSVFHNVAYGLKLRGVNAGEIERRVEEALRLVGLSGLERRRARTLSGGEVQRMAIARAVVLDPAVLILDEPTAHVDAAHVREVEGAVTRLRDKGVTVILATHGNDQACRLSDRLLRIEQGRIEEGNGRIASARLSRAPDGLRLEIGEALSAPASATLVALELAGDSVILRLSGQPSLARVPKNEIDAAQPLPGERVQVSGREKGPADF